MSILHELLDHAKALVVGYPVLAVAENEFDHWRLHAFENDRTDLFGEAGAEVVSDDTRAWDRLLSQRGLQRRTEWRQVNRELPGWTLWQAYCDKPGRGR